MKRLLMLSLLLSVAALQAIREGEYNPPAMPGRPATAGPTTSGTIAADGSVVSGPTTFRPATAGTSGISAGSAVRTGRRAARRN